MRVHRSGRKPAPRRPQSGRQAVLPRPSSARGKGQRLRTDPSRGPRVNQKMINGMVIRRTQGYTHAQIARHYGVSERTVRRHTKGVSPQLVHAGDLTRVDLMQWCARQVRAIQQHWGLSIGELDLVMKRLRRVISELDDMTVEQLELDHDLRVQFLMKEVWAPAHEKIDDVRLYRGIQGTRERLKVSGVTATRPV